MFVMYMVPALIIAFIAFQIMKSKAGFQKEFRDKAQGYNDLLRYNRPIIPGVFLGKGGELMAGFTYRGVDLDSSTQDLVNSIMARINSALSIFDEGWMVHVDQSRLSLIGYPEQGAFPHPLLTMIDQQRRHQYEAEGLHFEGHYTIVITWKPPSLLDAKISSLLYETSADLGNHNLAEHYLKKFDERVREFGSQIQGMFHNVKRLTDYESVTEEGNSPIVIDALASHLHYCATGKSHPIRASMNNGIDLDTLIASEDFIGGNDPRVGRKYIRPVSLDGYPSEAGPLILEALNRLPIEYRWSTRFIFYDQATAQSVIDRIRKKWNQKVRPISDQIFNKVGGIVDRDAQLMADDAQEAYAESSSGLVRHGHHTSVIILMNEDPLILEDSVNRIMKTIGNLGFPCRREEANAVEAFLGTLPGHGYENVRKPLIHTMNLAYLFPATAIWAGVKRHPCKFYNNAPALFMADASGSTPFSGVTHVDDVGHFKLLGPTGSGKSTGIQFLIAQQFRYENAKVYLFEKGYSGYALCSALGKTGRHFDISGENDGIMFAPLADVDVPYVRRWAEEWIVKCCELQGVQVSASEMKEIRISLERLGESARQDRNMTNYLSLIQNVRLRDALMFYTLRGSCPALDAEPSQENVDFALYNVFEMEHLMSLGEKYVAPILLYLFHKIERTLKGQPTWIILDEAWLMLMHPIWRDYIMKWLKTLRKANVGVGFATQEVGDAARSAIADVIFASTPTSILLPNPDVRRPDVLELYRQIGMNDQQINLIQYGTAKRDYYYTSPLGNRLFSLSLDPFTLAFVGVSGREEVDTIKQLQRDYGEKWVIEWTRRRAGASWAAELARRLAYE